MAHPSTGPVICLGEAMVMLRPEEGGGLIGSDLLRRSVGGAEANVASALAALGTTACWVSRLGRDPFGDYIEADLRARGVTVLAERDRHRQTGVYFKDSGAAGSRMHYYRDGSAATAMDHTLCTEPGVADALASCTAVHTCGITAGILTPGSDLLPVLVDARDRLGFTLSVDLNWRPSLWRGRSRDRLLRLVRAADVLLLGADEAEDALGSSDPARLRQLVGHRPTLVIKSDAHVATEVTPDGTSVTVPALQVDVVEPIGADDGFAAGYLQGLLAGHDPAARLRLGHLVAASVLSDPGDHVTHLPDQATRRALITLPDRAWRTVRVRDGDVQLPTGAG